MFDVIFNTLMRVPFELRMLIIFAIAMIIMGIFTFVCQFITTKVNKKGGNKYATSKSIHKRVH